MLEKPFPNFRHRNMLGGISTFFNLSNIFMVVKLFTNLQVSVGMSGIFWIYSGMSMASVIFVALFVPETKGKTLNEIEAYFNK